MAGNRGPTEEEGQSLSRSFLRFAQNMYARHTLLLRVAGIMAILLFAFCAGMAPHWDYEYPLHVDEWKTIGYTQSMLEGGQETGYANKAGFYMFLGALESTTGLSWAGLYRFGPGVLVALLAFLVYAFGRRDGFGWAAALFVPLIPTSIRTLGPTFLVGISTSLIFIPVTLLVLHRLEAGDMRQRLLLLILILGALFFYPPTGGIIIALAALYLATAVIKALAVRRYRAAGSLSTTIALGVLIPIIILAVWLPDLTKTVLRLTLEGDPGLVRYLGINTGFLEALGIIAVALFVWGVFAFMLDRRYGLRTYILPAFVMLLSLFLYFVYPRYQLGYSLLYERSWSYLGLFMVILAGYGIAYYFWSIPALANKVRYLLPYRPRDLTHLILVAVGVIVIAAALTTGLANNERERYANYYHMVDEQIYADFVWLGQHTIPGHKVVMMEPSLAWAYPPIAGPGNTVALARSAPYHYNVVDRVREVLVTGNVNTDWLRDQNVSVMYTLLPGRKPYRQLNNSDMPEVRPGVYLVPIQQDL